MLKSLPDRVCAFDLEWVPDPLAGRLVYGLSADMPDIDIVAEMYRRGGATDENPRPYLKTAVCRIVSVAGVYRMASSLKLFAHAGVDEGRMIRGFLDWLGEFEPCLVGFNSVDADLPILLQRAVVLGVRAEEFARRPEKPWLGRDYFARENGAHVDLKRCLAGFGKATPSLHEIAVQSGIPGKFGVDGTQVVDLWLAGELDRIRQYNEFDAITTYLVWLRVAHFAGLFTTIEYEAEQDRVRALLSDEGAMKPHLTGYIEEWTRLRTAIVLGRPR